MEQLTEMDYSFLQMENSRTFQHISVVMVYDQNNVEGIVRFKQIIEWFNSKLPLSKVFRRKLAGNTRGLDNPYWIEDSDFDLEFHMRHIALPRPGDWRQFCIQMARLHSRSIDLSRPPWEAYIIEGLHNVESLPKDCFAIFLKIHHAAVDGMALTEIINGLHSESDDPTPLVLEDNWESEPEPTSKELWSSALRNTIGRPQKLAKMLGNAFNGRDDTNTRGERPARQEHAKARTRFNANISAHRVIEAITLDLEAIKGIKRALAGATVNDVIVSIVGGAMRKYLAAKTELPEEGLSAGVPVNVRNEQEDDARGNQIGIIWIKLGTDVEDPMKRLAAVRTSALQAKEELRAGNPRTMLDFGESVGPILFRATTRLGSFMPQHTVISNIPGPREPYFIAGARLHSLYAMGPLSDGIGLAHGVISCEKKLSITAVCCREIMPDPEFYRECLQEAWDELSAASQN